MFSNTNSTVVLPDKKVIFIITTSINSAPSLCGGTIQVVFLALNVPNLPWTGSKRSSFAMSCLSSKENCDAFYKAVVLPVILIVL